MMNGNPNEFEDQVKKLQHVPMSWVPALMVILIQRCAKSAIMFEGLEGLLKFVRHTYSGETSRLSALADSLIKKRDKEIHQ